MGNTVCNKDQQQIEQDQRDIKVPDLSLELPDEYFEVEKNMLRHSGLQENEVQVHNVVIDKEGNYIRTYEVMVVLHGYGGSSIMYYKCMKALSEKFHIYFLDILGMGASSRPLWTDKTPEEGLEYMVEWIEVWRQTMGDLRGFILAGHSFGGYLSGHYTLKYKKYVKKLFLLSPFGVPKRDFTDEEFLDRYEEYMTKAGPRAPPKFAFKLSRKVWANQWSPFGMLRKSPRCFQNYILNRYVRRRIGGDMPPEEMLDYKEYMRMTLLRKASTEYALFTLFDHYCFSKLPLDDVGKLPTLDIPVSFMYGDRDWMKRVGEHDCLKDNPFKGVHSHYHTLENSDHNLFLDNAQGFIDLVMADLHNLEQLECPWLELRDQQYRQQSIQEENAQGPVLLQQQIC